MSLIDDDKTMMQQALDLTHELKQSSPEIVSDDASNQGHAEDKFSIFLDIEVTDIYDQEIIINPYISIRELIRLIVTAFKLPLLDIAENPVHYILARYVQDSEEPTELDCEDEDGRELSISDYDIQPGDRIIVISIPVAGGASQPMEIGYLPAKRTLLQRLFGIHSKVSYASAFVPDSICRNSSMMVQVYLYSDGERDKVCAEATRCDHITKEKAFAPLHARLKVGDFITVHLRIHGLEIERSEKTIVWQGHYAKACFHVSIDDWKDDRLYGEIFISINHTIIGELDFITNVTSNQVTVEKTANVMSRQYKQIFISYAHQDEDKVKYIAEAYRAQGIDYFFDRHYLKGGDIFPLIIQDYIKNADLFLLCWSENAAHSDYVAKERSQALQLAFPHVQPFEKAKLTIYPISIEPYAELPEDMRDYYNFEQL